MGRVGLCRRVGTVSPAGTPPERQRALSSTGVYSLEAEKEKKDIRTYVHIHIRTCT